MLIQLLYQQFEMSYRTWSEYGKHYGFPKCCINEFVLRNKHNDDNPSDYIDIKRIPRRICENSGLVPCSYCSWKVLTKQCKLEDLIVDRECKHPFPMARGVCSGRCNKCYTRVSINKKLK